MKVSSIVKILCIINLLNLLNLQFSLKADIKNNEALIILPEHLAVKSSRKFLDAKQTCIIPAKLTKFGLQKLSIEEFYNLSSPWQKYLAKAQTNSKKLNEKIQLIITKNQSGYIILIQIKNYSPYFPSLVSSVEFYKRFVDKLGKRFYISYPQRFLLILFPIGLLEKDQNFISSKIAIHYDSAVYPASKEIFLYDGQILKTAAIIQTKKP